MQFYPLDWIADCRVLSLQTRGAWIDILCHLWRVPTKGTDSLPVETWAQLLGCNLVTAESVINELQRLTIADIDREEGGNVRITCRRLVRMAAEAQRQTDKSKRSREEQEKNREKTAEKSEVRSQNKENTEKKAAELQLEATQPEQPAVLTFDCSGSPSHWPLTQAKLNEWQTLYPQMDVLAECRRALQWTRDTGKRKTAKGMPKFIGGWLSRANDKGAYTPRGQTHQPAPSKAPYTDAELLTRCRELLSEGRCGFTPETAAMVQLVEVPSSIKDRAAGELMVRKGGQPSTR